MVFNGAGYNGAGFNGAVPRRPLLLLALVVLAAWSGAVARAGFALDDREVLEGNPAVEGSLGWRAAFLRDYWEHHPAGAAGHYRPLATASLRLDHGLHGASARGCHATNVLLHLGVVLLAAALFRARERRLPLVGLALFAAHPALADSVAWISGRTSMISALGGLAGAWLVARRAREGDRVGVALGAALAGFLALLGKEDGLVFVLLALALALERGRRLVPAAALGGVVGVLGYAALRHAALGAWLPSAPHAPLGATALLERLRVAGGAGLEGLRVAVWPIRYPPVWGLEDFEDTALSLALVAWALLAGALTLGALRPRCDALAGLALAAAAVLPLAQIVPSGELLAPRFLYLPLLFAAPAVHAAWRELGQRPTPALVVLGLCVGLAWQRAGVYASRASFWEARRVHRETPQVLNALGNARLEEGDREGAREAYEQALLLQPGYSKPWVNLAVLELRRDEPDLVVAEQHLRRAIAAHARNPIAWFHLGRVLRETERPAEAVRAYERAIEISPGAATLWRGLARARAEARDEEGARAAREEAARLDPPD